jgi:hypothetical protein
MRRVARTQGDFVVPDNYIIEIRPDFSGRVVQAGIVIREGGGFRFFAASDAFFGLQQRLFKNPQAAAASALRHIEGCRAQHSQLPPFGHHRAKRNADSQLARG